MPLSAPSSDRAPRHALNASGLRAELHALQPHDPALAREMEEAFHITDSNGRDNGPEPAMPDDEEYYSDGSSYVLSSGQEDGEPDQNQSLTRQLAETAVGVREMSKQLGRARVKSTIESVLIITKARDNQLITYTRDLALWLMLSQRKCGRGLIVYVDRQLQRSKRFNAAGIQKTYPHIFDPIAHRAERQSSSSSPNHGTVPNATEGQLRYWTPDLCTEHPELIDFVVTLGGDGTVLFASWLFQRIVPPVLPFSLGSLGFLTNFEFGQFKKVMESVLEDGIRVNMRMRFTATVYRVVREDDGDEAERQYAIRSGKTGAIYMKEMSRGAWQTIENGEHEGCTAHTCKNPDSQQNDGVCPAMDKEVKCFTTRPQETFEVLNDLVVDRGPSPFVTLLEIFGNEYHMTTAQADGICIATPTGSTAYSLAAGGSLAHPEIPAILITPICPHTLSFRPMLLPDSMDVRIVVPYNSRSTAWASFDGRGRVELKQGDHIKVTASRYPFPSVCRDNQSVDWFRAISSTLKWNQRQRQKSFVVLEDDPEEDELEDDDHFAGTEDKPLPAPAPAPAKHAGLPANSPAPASSFAKPASGFTSLAQSDSQREHEQKEEGQFSPGPNSIPFGSTNAPGAPASHKFPFSEPGWDQRKLTQFNLRRNYDIEDNTQPGTPNEGICSQQPTAPASNASSTGAEMRKALPNKQRKSTEALPRLPLSHLTRTHAPKGMRMSSLRLNPSRSQSNTRSVPGSGTHTPSGSSAAISSSSMSDAPHGRSSSPTTNLGQQQHPGTHGNLAKLLSMPSDDGSSQKANPSSPAGQNRLSIPLEVSPPAPELAERSESSSSPDSYSPDRWGSAGPPKPPLAVSHRHMAGAGFRHAPATARPTSPSSRPRRREGSVAAELAASAHAARQSAAQRRASLVAGNLADHLNPTTSVPSSPGSGFGGRPGLRASKTALVVYGDDDSDSELEEEGGRQHVH